MSTLTTMYRALANSPSTITVEAINASATTVRLEQASILPDTIPCLLTFGYDKKEAETVLVTGVSGTQITMIRGVDGTAAAWPIGTRAARTLTAKDLNDLQDNILALNEGKQESLTFDNAPTSGSSNPVKSSGIKAALDEKADGSDLEEHADDTTAHITAAERQTWNGKQNALTFDNAPTAGSSNPVKSSGVKSALDDKADLDDFQTHDENTQCHVSTADRSKWNGKADQEDFEDHEENTTVHITASERSAWNGKQDKITANGVLQGNGSGGITAKPVDTTPTDGGSNLITSGGVAQGLSSKANTSDLTSHTGNTTVHITASERSTWNGKENSGVAAGLIQRTDNVAAANTAYGTVMARGMYFGTTDLTAGTSPLTSGVIYGYYE